MAERVRMFRGEGGKKETGQDRVRKLKEHWNGANRKKTVWAGQRRLLFE
jgi:hypothetical protein